jgi:hypothetical protein
MLKLLNKQTTKQIDVFQVLELLYHSYFFGNVRSWDFQT